MSTEGIFHLRGNTRRFTATANPPLTAVQVSRATGFPPASDYILTNFGPSVVYVGWGPDQDTAIANARAPVVGDSTGAFCYIVHPGQRSIEAKDAAYFAAVTESGSADVLVTPGHGLIDGFGVGNSAAAAAGTGAMLALLAYSIGAQQELIRDQLIELRTITEFLKQGLNVSDDPEAIRSDNAASLN